MSLGEFVWCSLPCTVQSSRRWICPDCEKEVVGVTFLVCFSIAAISVRNSHQIRIWFNVRLLIAICFSILPVFLSSSYRTSHSFVLSIAVLSADSGKMSAIPCWSVRTAASPTTSTVCPWKCFRYLPKSFCAHLIDLYDHALMLIVGRWQPSFFILWPACKTRRRRRRGACSGGGRASREAEWGGDRLSRLLQVAITPLRRSLIKAPSPMFCLLDQTNIQTKYVLTNTWLFSIIHLFHLQLLLILLNSILSNKGRLDVRNDTSSSNRSLDKSIQLFVSTNGKL